MSDTEQLGPLVRLWGLRAEQLPAPTAGADELAPFLIQILQEAVPFIDGAAPKSSATSAAPSAATKLWKAKATKKHADSAAAVEVTERTIPARALDAAAAAARGGHNSNNSNSNSSNNATGGGEYWCCRRSVHEDAARRGTASWDEFDRCFRLEHGETERAFTPNVLAAHEAVRWRGCAGVEAAEQGTTWGDFSLALVEMRHKVGRPVLKDRTFPVLQMTCRAVAGAGAEGAAAEDEFLVVSIPVPDFGRAPAAAELTGDGGSRLASEKGAQVAYYVSVERVRRLAGGPDIEWLMATASDAAGVLPAWVQNMAMPGVVWKDVPLFLGWIAREREGRGGGSGATKGQDKDKDKKGKKGKDVAPTAAAEGREETTAEAQTTTAMPAPPQTTAATTTTTAPDPEAGKMPE
ncbi:hypothetical protein GGR56DRAFT_181467 [Xylariaceae sp. FL0804]|nr:hypothetical protein GGR56DRAFT_181467 [Xylariaceae sp. FL0804]